MYLWIYDRWYGWTLARVGGPKVATQTGPGTPSHVPGLESSSEE